MSPKNTPQAKKDPVAFQNVVEKWRTIRLGISEIGRVAAISIPAYFFYRAIDAIAGKTTIFSALIQLLSDKYFANSVMALATFASVVYGLNERRLRKKVIARDHERVQKLEQQIDEKRSSAALSPSGEPIPQ